MNKPLPWNVKGVGFDAREAARLAAKRAGMPLGEWLNGVISARAAELGVAVEDVESEDRLEAIASRLSANDDAPVRAAKRDAIDTGPRNERPNPASQPREAVPSLSGTAGGEWSLPMSQAAVVKSVSPAPLRTPGGAMPRASATAPVRIGADAALSDGQGRSRDRHIGASVARLVAEPTDGVAADQLDERLNTILAKLNRSFEAAAEIGGGPVADPVSSRRVENTRGAVRTSPRPTGAAPVTSRAVRDVAADRVASDLPDPRATAQRDAGNSSFSDLHSAFKSLAEKLEAQLADAQAGSAGQHRGRNGLPSIASDAGPGRNGAAEIKQLQRELAQLAASVADLTPQRSLASLESAVRDLSGRIDLSRLDGVQASLLAPVEQLGQDMREAIRSTDATAAVEAVRRDMKALAAKLEAQPARGSDDRAIEGLRSELRDLRDVVGTVADRLSASERLQDEISALGERIGTIADRASPSMSRDLAQAIGDIRDLLQTFEPHSGLNKIDQKIDHLSARIESMAGHRSPDAYFTDMMRQIDRAHETLMDRLAGRAMPQADLSGIEQSLGTLSAKIDTMGRGTQDVNALYGLVGNLADRMQEARDPQADGQALSALQQQIAQLVDRLDRSETDHATLHGLERLIGDLFLQIEQSRNVAIDAAENAARAAAQDTLRAAMDNPTLNGAELTVQTGLDVDHVSQELSELRRVQEASDRRITGTLTALNTTLERLVDHLVAAPHPVAAAVEQGTPNRAERRRRAVTEPAAREPRLASDLPPFDPEQFLIEPGSLDSVERDEVRPSRTGEVAGAPVPKVGMDTSGTVAPLIAAARRAAQAAHDSALDVSLKPAPDGTDRSTAAPAGKAQSFFANRRRPLLLALAGVVLLLGTLQIVRLSTQSSGDVVPAQVPAPKTSPAVPETAPAAPGPKADKGASLTSAPADQQAAAPGPVRATGGPDPISTGSVAPTGPASDTAALAGLGQGLKDLAASGNAAAQFEVASRLADGKGVVRDPKTAAGWFARSASQGFAPAQYRLGSVYEKGVGLTADPALAVAWYEKAAGQGNIRAMHNLAVMSAEGAGSKPDYGKAVSWFTKAASYGVRDSQYNLAVLFARGLGVPQNLGQSYAWFALAAQQGDADAVAKRDTVAAKLDAKALADAKATVASFHPLTADPAANDVAPPPGGWDAIVPAKTASARKTEARISSM